MSQNISIARNTIVQTIGKIISIAAGWATLVILTNYLGAAGFGSYTIMSAYLQFFGVAADLGFVLVSAQLLAEKPQEKDKVFANLLTFRLTTALILFLAPLVIWLFPYSLLIKQGVVILTFSFFIIALLQVFTGLFQKELAMGRALLGELAGRLVLLAVVLIALLAEKGLLFVVWGVVFGSLANLLLVVLLSRRFLKISLAWDREIWLTIWQRSWPITLGIVFNLVYLKADTLILSLTRSEAEVGIYGAMYRVLEVLITFPTMFAGLLLPVLAAAWARQDLITFRQTLQKSLDVVIYLAWPLVIGVAFTAARLSALFGSEFRNSGVILLMLVIATSIIFVGTYFGHVIVAVGRQRSMIWAYALTAAISLVGYLVFIPAYGAYGAAGMTIVAELIMATLGYVMLKKFIGKRPSLSKLGVAFLATVPMAIFLWSGASLPLLVLITGSMLIYGITLYAFGILTREFITALIAIS
ncbi:hypothetical protein A3H10_00475 [Candidatus Uhrbacteria bacterium RIFCSPLOWO2_12_FULL_46_10]|uniref:Uncharacterized protein n=1 Tax=Candidatus Uhrbacteria bacterium RIFCSPLOWO2_01_FULL_47_25 TaxID=1802402 RepID=A0A1F7US52_9BACT|nr:MAG: Heteropolysaccharide repeat unit export protein [Parcubacteria group bacterium GW2011_GWA2_46_9]OGL59287.1 MAG: hypothetical protein A2752_01295 [Candidatus Uhrbacteria bacterium RIFCSPHIGHO2_01_FULL_46_23]OGL68468.1 MAG: hypothetical protein A3D60_02520 [Candidatus Uhrbacteria bacterium RIFCSPHIGHO2_02_FULL_47_29]OGL75604.1 MAG: hypothetical protein A3E96_01015 [Candidatus Uhrbacteria bacterium RIFCSPHIGHO2_12_FULL_46_13]OGL81120.1 MAG: hypothetical protein A2936_00780 [Candidatus Uhrb